MSERLFEQDIEEEVILPWRVICRLAVYARCRGISLNDVMSEALQQYIRRGE